MLYLESERLVDAISVLVEGNLGEDVVLLGRRDALVEALAGLRRRGWDHRLALERDGGAPDGILTVALSGRVGDRSWTWTDRAEDQPLALAACIERLARAAAVKMARVEPCAAAP